MGLFSYGSQFIAKQQTTNPVPKFTPGPWLTSTTTVYALNDQGVNRFFAPVMDCHTHGDELLANAQLMSAAPDMHQALTELMDYEISCSPTLWHQARVRAINALRKANKEPS